MSQQYSIEQIPVNLYKIIQEIEQGEPVEITREGEQVAVIISTDEYKRLLNKSPGFWESLPQFRQEIMAEGMEIDPD